MTLRITRIQVRPSGRTTLLLEGRLVDDWAELLECETYILLRGAVPVRIDLKGVRLVDRAGVEVLKRLVDAGVEIRCRPGAVASVLEGEGVRVTLEDDRVSAITPSRTSAPDSGQGEHHE